jgi:hypothetical protein
MPTPNPTGSKQHAPDNYDRAIATTSVLLNALVSVTTEPRILFLNKTFSEQSSTETRRLAALSAIPTYGAVILICVGVILFFRFRGYKPHTTGIHTFIIIGTPLLGGFASWARDYLLTGRYDNPWFALASASLFAVVIFQAIYLWYTAFYDEFVRSGGRK